MILATLGTPTQRDGELLPNGMVKEKQSHVELGCLVSAFHVRTELRYGTSMSFNKISRHACPLNEL